MPRFDAVPARLSAAALASVALIFGCFDQPSVSAEEVRSAMEREQFDELSSARLRDSMASTAADLLAGLPRDLRYQARRELDDEERKAWNYWPSRYPGARLDAIPPEQGALADRLLRTALSETGYEKLKLIQALEPYNPWRSPFYSLMVFGDPQSGRPWGWRLQGHHLSLNFTLADGEPIAATPLFLGSQPLSHPSVAQGKAPLAAEEELALALYRSLDAEQRRKSDIRRPPYSYLPLRTPSAERQTPLGVLSKDLSAEQRDLLLRLIEAYIQNAAPSIAAQQWEEIEQAGLDEIGFARAGGEARRSNSYYRIQGPTFYIEYDSRDGGKHIHSVWRSFDGDFGEDLLRRHYLEAHHAGDPPPISHAN